MIFSLHRLRDGLVFYPGLLLYAGMSLLWIAIAVLLYPILPENLGRTVGRFGIRWGWRIYFGIMTWCGAFRFDTRELETLRNEAPLLLVANHPSLLDAVIIASRLPNLVCIMRAGVSRNLLLGPGAHLARYIRNDSGHGMVKQAVAELRRGAQLLVFPEGTRTVGTTVNRFKGGAALIARQAGVPIQTLVIETDSPFLGKGWSPFRIPRLPIRFRIRLGPRFEPPQAPTALLDALEAFYAGELAGQGSRRHPG
ncbi:MAG TPA: lysophospholipid acyltransferase family protein [Methylococcus sp.]|nr:lysophospholipid acyltransferase family protein [Methylococcus sp.]